MKISHRMSEDTRCQGSDQVCNQQNKKVFQSMMANCPLADRCVSCIVNRFEEVWGRRGGGASDQNFNRSEGGFK